MQVCESTPDASRPVIGDGEGFLAELEKRELERMVAKRADSLTLANAHQNYGRARRDAQAHRSVAAITAREDVPLKQLPLGSCLHPVTTLGRASRSDYA